MCDSRPASGSTTGPSDRRRTRARTSSSRCGFRVSREPRTSALEPWAGIGRALESQQGRPDEELEADEHRDRVPGQPEDEPVSQRRRTRSACPASSRRPRTPPRRRARPGSTARDRAARPRRRPRSRGRRRRARAREPRDGRLPRPRPSSPSRPRRPPRPAAPRAEFRSPRRSVPEPAARPAGEARCPSRRRRPAASARRAPRGCPPPRARPSCRASRRAPASTTVSPAPMSPPAGRMFAPRSTACSILDRVVIFDNILEGDDGIGSLRHDSAGGDAHRLSSLERTRRRACPQGSGERPAAVPGVSLERSAKPSIAELSNGGRSTAETASSASTRPNAPRWRLLSCRQGLGPAPARAGAPRRSRSDSESRPRQP